MPQDRTGAFAIALVALVLAGCQTERFGSPYASRPAPLAAAPSGSVTVGQLPPPSQPTGITEFPAAPGAEAGGQMAAIDPATQAGAGPVSKNSLLGSWNVSTAGASCQMFLTLTKYGNSSRGGTRGCGNELANMRAWDVSGNQVVIYNENGDTIAQLYPSGQERLDGRTTNGSPVSISR
ncbi:protease inhibitor Inh/omp19 family protein [Chelativorans sp. Marseille-P2723]|uniref:protease inhibitor Inh/omp19 family protein n=1 Tax=Chelativorans sp. Marseille-P2723 TaxID=2709133 RepID=UPI0015704B32|nr:protease inhibitor Inh/omp19 family protein [Chelativorans sp. Marseille-P2723]